MKIIMVLYPDWDAIYVDGICKKENDNLSAGDILEILENYLPCSIESIETKEVDEGWWEQRYNKGIDCYPEKIEDIVFQNEES
jgi:hypothetical protein